VIARIPRETTKTKDITGGLPRVAELFEPASPRSTPSSARSRAWSASARTPRASARCGHAEIDGKMRTDLAKEYLIAKGKHINVHAGDRVKAGDPLMDGAANPHDILKVLGEKELARYMVDEVQEVYRLQGREDQRQAHRDHRPGRCSGRVRVQEVGDTNFLVDEQVEKQVFRRGERPVTAAGGKPAVGEPLLARHHQGLPVDGVVHLRLLVPGDHQGADRGGDLRARRLPARSQGERHHGPPDPRGTGLTAYKHLDIEVETPVDEVEAAKRRWRLRRR